MFKFDSKREEGSEDDVVIFKISDVNILHKFRIFISKIAS
jgi:hypothetical protein